MQFDTRLMQHIPEHYCADTIEHIRNRTTCDWCHHPSVPVMPRTHLCNHCNRIRKELNRLEERNERFLEQHGGLTFTMQWELDVQRAMVENAKAEGSRYGRFYDEDLT